MAGTPLTSLRTNSMPVGGPTALQPVAPNAAPQDILAIVNELAPVISQFRANSSDMEVPLNQVSFKAPGDEVSTRITSVGLGYRTISEHQVTIGLNNTAAAAQVVDLSPYFPFNLLDRTTVSVNGGTTVYSVSGVGSLLVAARSRRGFFQPFGSALNPALCKVSFGAGITATATAAGGFSFSGYDSISIAANTNTSITVTFYTFEKLAYSRDSLLGALPLQNNSVYAQLTRKIAGVITGADKSTPLYVGGGAPGTLATTLTSYTINTTYKFWSVPSNPALYQDMVNNSFQVQEQSNLAVNATGAGALVYDLPQNQYLTAAHLLLRDKNNAPLGATDLSKLLIQYNGGSVIPIVRYAGRSRAEEFLDYGADIRQVPGYVLWDGDSTSDDPNHTDEAGWIDTYSAATPQVVADIAAGVQTPVTYSIIRESVVAGAVQVVG